MWHELTTSRRGTDREVDHWTCSTSPSRVPTRATTTASEQRLDFIHRPTNTSSPTGQWISRSDDAVPRQTVRLPVACGAE